MQPVFTLQAARRLQQDGAPAAPSSCARGVICASAGNHAQGVALAAQQAGLPRRRS
jgi:threonine dehydratase